ncbi:MAG: hypothetical protein IPL26_09680 [Leptospiraceae bacterium]|nr:hypothetical protein [Leptospiraceae bacterium]
MRIILIICILMINFQNCEQPKSNEDKMKSNYSEKPTKFIGDYLYLRMLVRSSFGHPICGGDLIGTTLGLNRDIPTPIPIEIGTTYEFTGNPNVVSAKEFREFGDSIFIINNPNKVSLLETIELKANCSDGISSFVEVCNGSNLTQNGTTRFLSNCFITPAPLDPNSSLLTINGSYSTCTFNDPPATFFLIIFRNTCQYTINYQGI